MGSAIGFVESGEHDRTVAHPAGVLTGVSLVFGPAGPSRLVLDKIDLTVRDGEFLCIVGPSGCGKTTLLRLIAGLLWPTAGELICNGEPILGPARDREIVFQDYGKALLPW